MKIRRLLPALFLCLCLSIPVAADEAAAQDASFSAEGFSSPQRLWDGDRGTYAAAGEGAAVHITGSTPIASLYIEFDRLSQPYTLEGGGGSYPCGEEGFLHQYIDVAGLTGGGQANVTLRFPKGTVIADIYAFSDGVLPDWVQVWEPPCEEADLLLLSSHSDDEQLFFAGILPYYAGERQLEVQVAYIVQHFEANGAQDHRRPHEQLDGLWTVGVRHYPIIPEFPDLYAESKDRAEALRRAKNVYQNAGYSYEDFVSYLTGCIRRCKPLVVVSHDLDGEYGHGTHVLCADALGTALQSAADPAQYPESAVEYGVWQVEKTYLHLYGENPIVMDWDVPLEHFGGKTAFQVTQEGFGCHKSQHWTWFYKWIYGTDGAPITKASQISRYSPCLFGLYDTHVGLDEAGGDFFEHVKPYAQRRAEAEEAARAEAERIAAEEAARAEAERVAAEEAAQAEAAQAAAAKNAVVQQITMTAGVLAFALLALLISRWGRHKKTSQRKGRRQQ